MSSDLSIDSSFDSWDELYLAPPLNRSDWNGRQIAWIDLPEARSEIERRILDIYNSGNHVFAYQLAILYFQQVCPQYELQLVKSSGNSIYSSKESFEKYIDYCEGFYELYLAEAKQASSEVGLAEPPPPESLSESNYPAIAVWKAYCLENGISLSSLKSHSGGFKEFWEEHKKAIIIAAVVIVVAAAVAVVIVTTLGTGTNVAVATGAAAVDAAIDGYQSSEKAGLQLGDLQNTAQTHEEIHNFAQSIDAASVAYDKGSIPIIEVKSLLSEVSPEILTDLARKWNENIPPTQSYEGPIFLDDGVLFNGQHHTYWQLLQTSRQEDIFRNLSNESVAESPPPAFASNDPSPYQPIPPKPGASFTRCILETFGRELLGPEIVEGTTPSDLQTSHLFTTAGKRQSTCRIGGINGINTSLDNAAGHADYLRGLSGGQSIDWIYNNTHGAIGDLAEVFTQNYLGFSPNTARLLTDNWVAFHEENKDNPKAKYLQICHSQGAIHVKNALLNAPKEIAERVIVVAIAPAAVITKDLCFDSYNYASKKDIVPFGELLAAGALDPGLIGVSGCVQTALENRKELILLDPHPDATGIDHDFRSPTFREIIRDHLIDHIENKGEYEK